VYRSWFHGFGYHGHHVGQVAISSIALCVLIMLVFTVFFCGVAQPGGSGAGDDELYSLLMATVLLCGRGGPAPG
jgi:hypothetical protein